MKKKKIVKKVKKKPEVKKLPNLLPAKMPNHIEEYFAQREAGKDVLTSRELFKAEKGDVDIKTELSQKEILIFNRLTYNDLILKSKKLKCPFEKLIYTYFRLKISLDRKSRGEFVAINQHQDKTDDILSKMSNISNITGVKK